MAPAWILLALTLLSVPARAQEATEPFRLEEWRVPGRAVDAFVVRDEAGRDTVLALSLDGSPPAERRFLTALPHDPVAAAAPLAVPRAVVAVDAAELGLAPGPELVWLSAAELLVCSLTGEVLQRHVFEPPLPLPPRTWELARIVLVRDWDGDGRPEALAPSLAGVRLVGLVPGDHDQTLAVPLLGDYGTPAYENYFRPGLLAGIVSWPSFEIGDDDGDGYPDLFAANRYELLVFRGGPEGLPGRPTRTLPFPPFTPEEERRHVVSTLLAFVRDLDGDGRADLTVHRMVGELMRSRSTTTIHPNTGSGVDPGAEPSARIERTGGSAVLRLDDLDGDGRVEVLEAYLGFGVLQAVRMLTLQRAELRLRVLSLAGEAGPVETWSDDLSFAFDLASSRVLGVLPFSEADWNADGLLDLCWADASGRLRFRLGETHPAGPGYGRVVASLPLAISGDLVAADLGADGLADFVAWDPLDREGRLRVGRNRGALPGTPPSLRARPGS